MTTPYVDPQTVHNPTTGTSPPASWGDTVRDNQQYFSTPPSVKQRIMTRTNTCMQPPSRLDQASLPWKAALSSLTRN